MLLSLYLYIKETTIPILLTLGGAYWEGMFFKKRGTCFGNLTFGGTLIKECALIRSFMVVQNNKSVRDII